jgi:hypothetical protein
MDKARDFIEFHMAIATENGNYDSILLILGCIRKFSSSVKSESALEYSK